MKGIRVPIGLGSMASWVRASSVRKSMYVANVPVEIAARTDTTLVIEVVIELRGSFG